MVSAIKVAIFTVPSGATLPSPIQDFSFPVNTFSGDAIAVGDTIVALINTSGLTFGPTGQFSITENGRITLISAGASLGGTTYLAIITSP
jgi:hypothetical protein